MEELNARPRVLLISLNLQPYFDEMYDGLIDALSNRAAVQRAKTPQAAIKQLTDANAVPPKAVLVTDEALANKRSNAPVWDAVLEYVRAGGTAVVMGHFSSFVKPLKIAPFFAKAGLPWEGGDYHRTVTVLNRPAVGESADRLPQSYSQKALAVKNVVPGDVWYGSSEDSTIQSAVFAPTSAHRPGQAAVALAKIGDGQLGYFGDVNTEKETNKVILVMCGLL